MSWQNCPDCGVRFDPSQGPNAGHSCPVASARVSAKEAQLALLIEIRDLLRELVQNTNPPR